MSKSRQEKICPGRRGYMLLFSSLEVSESSFIDVSLSLDAEIPCLEFITSRIKGSAQSQHTVATMNQRRKMRGCLSKTGEIGKYCSAYRKPISTAISIASNKSESLT